MPRIFASLAIATIMLFAVTAALAFIENGSAPDRHVLLAVGTLLVSCFIQVVGFTYLTVTGKVIAQAVNLASLDPAYLSRVKQYKRSFARCVAGGIVGVVLASATGGTAWRSHDALAAHLPAAMGVAIIHVWIYRLQYLLLRRNADLLEVTLVAYTAWRDQRVGHNASLAGSAEGNVLAP